MLTLAGNGLAVNDLAVDGALLLYEVYHPLSVLTEVTAEGLGMVTDSVTALAGLIQSAGTQERCATLFVGRTHLAVRGTPL